MKMKFQMQYFIVKMKLKYIQGIINQFFYILLKIQMVKNIILLNMIN